MLEVSSFPHGTFSEVFECSVQHVFRHLLNCLSFLFFQLLRLVDLFIINDLFDVTPQNIIQERQI